MHDPTEPRLCTSQSRRCVIGFVGDAISDVGNAVGHQFGFGGGANQFRVGENYAPDIQNTLGNQQSFIQALQNQMGGGGPSVAQQLLRQQTDANNANAASLAGSARGLNPALAQRMILDRTAQNNQMAAQQGGLLRAQEMLGTQGLLGQTLGGRLNALGGMQQGVNQINAGVAGQNAGISSNAIGGLLNGAGSAAAGLFAKGGEVPDTFALTDPLTYIGLHSAAGPDMGGLSKLGGALGKYGADSIATFSPGGRVPGRAPVSGDSSRNDTVPAKLSPGEIVLPRSVTEAEDAPEKAAAFVRAIRRQKAGGPEQGYGKVLARMRELEMKVNAMADGGKVAAYCAGGKVGYADGGEVKEGDDKGTIAALAEALKHLVARSGQSDSSPSVFDAASAMREHNKRLQQAAEGQ